MGLTSKEVGKSPRAAPRTPGKDATSSKGREESIGFGNTQCYGDLKFSSGIVEGGCSHTGLLQKYNGS